MSATDRLASALAGGPHVATLNRVLSALFALATVATFLTVSTVSTGDDGGMLNILRAGEPGALIISYPLGWLLAQLYTLQPAAPFYSSLLVASTLLAYANVVIAFAEERGSLFFLAVNCVVASMLIQAAGRVSITLVTIVLFISSLCALLGSAKKTWPWLGIAVAVLLRPLWQTKLLVLFAAAALVLIQARRLPSRRASLRRLATIALLVLGVQFSPRVFPGAGDYRAWLDYNYWRAQVGDFESVKPGSESSPTVRDVQDWHFFDVPLAEIRNVAVPVDVSPRNIWQFVTDGGAWRYLREQRRWILPTVLLWIALLFHRGPPLPKVIGFLISLAPLVVVCTFRDRFRLNFALMFLPVGALALFRGGSALADLRSGFARLTGSVLYAALLAASIWLCGERALWSYRLAQLNAETTRSKSASFDRLLRASEYRDYNKVPSIFIPFKFGFRGFHNFRLFHETTDLPDWFERRVVPAGWATNHPTYHLWMERHGYNGYCDMIRSDTLYFGRTGRMKPALGGAAVRAFIVRRCHIAPRNILTKWKRIGDIAIMELRAR